MKVVDHKHPVADGGEMFDPGNFWGLCTPCHSGWKASLEAFARRTDQVERLRVWCDDPDELPRQFRELKPA